MEPWLLAAATGQLYFLAFGGGASRQAAVLINVVATALTVAPVFAYFWARQISQLKASQSALEHLAWTDHLTGLPNRQAFVRYADGALADAKSGNVALLMIDVDDFKSINESVGQAAGDAALVCIADTISRTIARATNGHCIAARLGGEEFAALVGRMSSDDVVSMAEAICANIRQATVKCGERQIQATVSIGIGFCLPGTTTDAALKTADEALYRAKGAGRDRCYSMAQGGTRHTDSMSRGTARAHSRAAEAPSVAL